MPATDNKMEVKEPGIVEEGINRKEWNDLMSLVQKVVKDLGDIKLTNENIQKEQIIIKKKQTETKKEIEELKTQTQKMRKRQEKDISLECRTKKLEEKIKDKRSVRVEDIKEVIDKTI